MGRDRNRKTEEAPLGDGLPTLFPESGSTVETALLPERVASASLGSSDIFADSGAHWSHRISEELLYDVAQNYVQYYAHGESHTARAKRYDLQYFLEFLAGSSERVPTLPVSAWTVQRSKDYVDSRLALGEAPATVSRRLATIKHFGRTLAERVPGYINPAREVKGPVLHPSRPRGLDSSEVELLRSAAIALSEEKKQTFASLRDRYLLELLLSTGLRADEVRLLVMNQVSADLYWLKNVKTKGKRYRNVYLDSHIREETAQYLEARERALRDRFQNRLEDISAQDLSRTPLLISFWNASLTDPGSLGLSPKTIFNAIANIGKKAESLSPLPMPNLHPHRLRHTFAHGLLDSSKDVRLVAQALGHSDIRTTMRYTERTEQEVARAMEEKLSHDVRRRSA